MPDFRVLRFVLWSPLEEANASAFYRANGVRGCSHERLRSAGTSPGNKPGPTAPAITQQPASQTVTAGQPATFSVAATGTAPLSYQWYMNGAAVGTDSSTFTIAQAAANQSGAQIYANISNSVGTTKSSTVSLTVTAAATAPTISQQPASVTVTAGQTANFSVGAAGTAPLTYQWFMNGTAAEQIPAHFRFPRPPPRKLAHKFT